MTLHSGAFLRFLRHDSRLSLRSFWAMLGERPTAAKIGILALVVVGLHAVAWEAARWEGLFEAAPSGAKVLAGAARAATLFIFSWSIASTMTAITRMLYQRGDLDLLFSAPIEPNAALAARVAGQGFEAVASVGILLLPFANAAALQGRPQWLALYPVLACDGLFGASAGLLLALGLFFAAGARRARVVSQIGATLVGASAVLFTQVAAMLPEALRTRMFDALSSHFSSGNPLLAILSLPERALLGEPVALLLWTGLAAAGFLLAIAVGARPFRLAAMQTAGAAAEAGGADRPARFLSSLPAALRRKEHRLLRRDPWLLSQMMLQTFYTLPVGVILWRQGGVIGSTGAAFGPTIAVIAGQLSGALAWIALSAEDAPDFLATAPASRWQVERAKLGAVAAPLLLVIGVPVALLATVSPWAAICTAACATGSAASGAFLMLWRQVPSRRGLVLRRHSQSKLVALGEHWLSLLWAVATGIAILGSVVFLAPIALAAATLFLARPRSRRAAVIAAPSKSAAPSESAALLPHAPSAAR